MSAVRFDVSFEIVTPESAEHNDTADNGWLDQGLTLRDALKALHGTRTNRVDGVESVTESGDEGGARSVTVVNGIEFETGAQESRTLFLPLRLTAATRRRIARLAGV